MNVEHEFNTQHTFDCLKSSNQQRSNEIKEIALEMANVHTGGLKTHCLNDIKLLQIYDKRREKDKEMKENQPSMP